MELYDGKKRTTLKLVISSALAIIIGLSFMGLALLNDSKKVQDKSKDEIYDLMIKVNHESKEDLGESIPLKSKDLEYRILNPYERIMKSLSEENDINFLQQTLENNQYITYIYYHDGYGNFRHAIRTDRDPLVFRNSIVENPAHEKAMESDHIQWSGPFLGPDQEMYLSVALAVKDYKDENFGAVGFYLNSKVLKQDLEESALALVNKQGFIINAEEDNLLWKTGERIESEKIIDFLKSEDESLEPQITDLGPGKKKIIAGHKFAKIDLAILQAMEESPVSVRLNEIIEKNSGLNLGLRKSYMAYLFLGGFILVLMNSLFIKSQMDQLESSRTEVKMTPIELLPARVSKVSKDEFSESSQDLQGFSDEINWEIRKLQNKTLDLKNNIVKLDKSIESISSYADLREISLADLRSSIRSMEDSSDLLRNSKSSEKNIGLAQKSALNLLASINKNSSDFNKYRNDMEESIHNLKESLNLSKQDSQAALEVASGLQAANEKIHLLSLSAAIEATNAESPRDFIKISDEIKRISENSRNSNIKIENFLKRTDSTLLELNNRVIKLERDFTNGEKSMENLQLELSSSEDIFVNLEKIVSKTNESFEKTSHERDLAIKTLEKTTGNIRDLIEGITNISKLSEDELVNIKASRQILEELEEDYRKLSAKLINMNN